MKKGLLIILCVFLIVFSLGAVSNFYIRDSEQQLILGTGGTITFPNISGVNNAITVETGDMLTTTYDTDTNDLVDAAEQLDDGTHTASAADVETHLAAVTGNPHSVTQTDVGLENVTNDAQLTRSANDFMSFSEKTSLAAADKLLLEDSENSGNKKYVQFSNLPSGTALTVTDDTTTVSSVDTLRFNPSSGFSVSDDGNNDVTINLGSSFNPFQVSGEDDIEATGEEALELIAGTGITITTNTASTPQSITIAATGSGSGDMLKTTYDTDTNDLVDQAEQLHDGTYTATAQAVSDHLAAVTGNPHSVTQTDVGLGNVTNDAQVKAALTSYSEKVSPADADIIVIADSEDSNTLKKVQLSQLASSSGSEFPVVTLENQSSAPSPEATKSKLYVLGPTTADPYTKLLIHSDHADGSTDITDATENHTVTVHGATHHEVDQQQFGASSIYFSGTNDFLSIPDHADFEFADGDFTVEMWVRLTTTGVYQYLFNKYASVGDNRGWTWYITNTNKLFFYATDDGYGGGGHEINVLGTTSLTNGVWYHLAAVRNGTSFKIYLNGTEEASVTSALSIFDSATALYLNDSDGTGTDAQAMYIDEVRVSKGIARWTANFTPPDNPYASPLPTQLLFQDETGNTTQLIRKTSIYKTIVGAATYTVDEYDELLHVTYTSVGGVVITIPTSLVIDGQMFSVKDAGGNANTYAITIETEGSETIDGAASDSITTDYGFQTYYCDGTNWFKR